MSGIPSAALWPAARLAEAIAALGSRSGFAPAGPDPGTPPEGAEAGAWIESTARALGMEAEPVEATYPEAGEMVRSSAPAVLRLPESGHFLAVAASGRRRLLLLGPDHALYRVRPGAVRAALCAPVEAPAAGEVAQLLRAAAIPPRREGRARAELLRELLGAHTVGGCWLIRPGGEAPLLAQLGGAGFVRRGLAVVGAHAVQYGIFILAWWLIGWIALSDRFDAGWLAAWLLLLVSYLSLRLFTYVSAGNVSIDLSAALKRRLLHGAFRLDVDRIRHLGAGQLLGRTLEVEAVESFTFLGALLLVTSAIELVFGGVVLALGAGGGAHAGLLAAWVTAAGLVGVAYYRERARWTESRLEVTNTLVEQIVGHRTRIAQEGRARWSARDDRDLERYHGFSVRQNRLEVVLETLVPRGWLLVGLLGLLPAFVRGGEHSAGALAAAVGGVLIGQRGLKGLVAAMDQLVGALVAWRWIRPLLRSAGPESPGSPSFTTVRAAAEGGARPRPVLDARGIAFRHRGRSEPVLREIGLRIHTGDRILLEGPSGGGKSTLGALLSGCRPAESGLLLLDGLDPATLGHAGWRRRVVFVPQFHENHVLMGSLAYNLLLGREWPPSAEDLRDAEMVCRELGLGPLLDRMPGGIFQIVGETGWQLSHGERSRLFIARALLQRPDVLILDESFAALDPGTLRSTLDYVFRSDSAVLVIAHP